MADQVHQQVLLEIALSFGGESEPQRLLEGSLPLIARRTGAVAAGVVRAEGDGWETVHVTPRALRDRTNWRDLVDAVLRSLPADDVPAWDRPVELGTAHVFRLADYGVLIIARSRPLDPMFVQAFVPLAEVMARPLIAGREQRRRLAAEVELQSLGTRHRGLLDALPFAAWLVDTDGRYVQVNSAFVARSGRDPGDLIGRTAAEVYPDPLGSQSLAATRQVLRTRQPLTVRDRDPHTGRTYEVDRTPYLDQDGRVLGVVGFRRDVSEREEAMQTVAQQAAFHELLTHLAVGFVNTRLDALDDAIDDALARTGTFAGVDRAYVFRYDFDAQTTSNTHEWCATGVEPMIGELQDTPMELFPAWLEAHLAGQLMHVPDVDALDPSNGLWQILAPQGIKTVIALPMLVDGACLGFVGFDAVQEVKDWTEGERQLLAVLAELVANAELRRRREQELVSARAAAESAQSRLELALRSGSEAIWEWDAATGRTLLSSALRRLTGDLDDAPRWVEPEDAYALLGEVDVRRLVSAVTATLQGPDDRFEVEATVRHTAGHELPVLIRGALMRDPDGVPMRMAGVIVDLTQSKREETQADRNLRAQAALARISARFVGNDSFGEAVDQAMEDLGTIYGASRAYVLLVDAEAGMLDNTHEWSADHVDPMIHRTQRVPLGVIPRIIERLRRGEAVLIADVDALPEDDQGERELFLSQQIRSLLSLPLMIGGELAGVLGLDQVEESDLWSSEDVALLRAAAEVVASALARARTDAELIRAREAAEVANEAKTRFLSTISHELRTPMNGVLGMTDLVLQGQLEPRQRKRIETAHTSARALLVLLDDILDVARIEAGHLTLRRSAFELHTVVEGAAAIARVDARRKGIELEVSIDPRLPDRVEGDAGRVRQIVANLLSNAVKFTDRGGVRLEVAVTTGPAVVPGTVEIVVADTGVGIPEADRERVFEPFVQIGPVETRGLQGTGLGLPIVRQLIEAMGGSIGLEGRSGGGTVITVRLPLPAAAVPTETRDAPSVRGFEGLHVLAVEDNLVNQEVLRGYLDELGCEVTVVDDGAAAITAVGRLPVDLVLMDCYMPGVDGFTATREIRRRDDAVGRIPIIAVTADASSSHATACYAAGMDGVLTKPFTRVELHDALREVADPDGVSTPPDDQELDPAPAAAPTPSTAPSTAPLVVGGFEQPAVAPHRAGGTGEDAATLAVFDPEPLRVLGQRRPPGDPLVPRLLALFGEHAPRHVADLSVAAAGGQADAYRIAAHTLKSNAATLGLRRLAHLSAEAERGVSAPQGQVDTRQLTRLAQLIEVAFEEAWGALEAAYPDRSGRA